MIDTSYEKAEIPKSREHIVDDEGIERPIFRIAGSEVAFRTRQEVPSFRESEQKYHIVSVADASPLVLERCGNEDYVDFVANGQVLSDTDVVEIVTATPEGIVGAAIELGSKDEDLIDILDSLRSGGYSVDALQLLDKMAAALSFGHDGKKLDNMDTDGHALVLNALLGNERAIAELSLRMESMYAYFETQQPKITESIQEMPERLNDIEAMDPKEVVLVHNTSHEVIIAEDGSVTLQSASAFREDRFPRSSLHFTPNGSVSDNIARVDGKSSRYIVANFADIVTKNELLPASMCSGDTYFTLNPGESLTIPGVRIVEGTTDPSVTELISREGAMITYKDSDHYTEEEEHEIKQLAEEYGFDLSRGMTLNGVLRKISLRKAMYDKGARRFVEIGSHFAEDQAFEDKYSKLATEMGVATTLHDNTGDARIEMRAITGANDEYRKKHYDDEAYRTFLPDTQIQSVRQVVASGHIPARPFATSHDPVIYGNFF